MPLFGWIVHWVKEKPSSGTHNVREFVIGLLKKTVTLSKTEEDTLMNKIGVPVPG